jgi:TRAP-type transport system periplasmic protein
VIGAVGLIVLRMASIVPDGTGWAREFKAFAREVESASAGAVKVKWYLGGIAGDESVVLDRIRRDQLDGMVSGGMSCEQLAPSIRVMRVPGMFQSWDESSYVLGRLMPALDKEFRHNGFAILGFAGVGPAVLFTRTPVASLDDLRKVRVWIWDIDQVLLKYLPGIGLKIVPTPIADAARAYEAGQHDGYVTPASAALGFQWTSQVRYFADLRVNFLAGCMIISNRAFDALPVEAQKIARVAAAKAASRLESIGLSP